MEALGVGSGAGSGVLSGGREGSRQFPGFTESASSPPRCRPRCWPGKGCKYLDSSACWFWPGAQPTWWGCRPPLPGLASRCLPAICSALPTPRGSSRAGSRGRRRPRAQRCSPWVHVHSLLPWKRPAGGFSVLFVWRTMEIGAGGDPQNNCFHMPSPTQRVWEKACPWSNLCRTKGCRSRWLGGSYRDKMGFVWAATSWWLLLAGHGAVPGQEGKLQTKCNVFKTVLSVESGFQKHLRKGWVGVCGSLAPHHLQSLWKPSLGGWLHCSYLSKSVLLLLVEESPELCFLVSFIPEIAGTGLGVGREQDLWWFWSTEYLSGMGPSERRMRDIHKERGILYWDSVFIGTEDPLFLRASSSFLLSASRWGDTSRDLSALQKGCTRNRYPDSWEICILAK